MSNKILEKISKDKQRQWSIVDDAVRFARDSFIGNEFVQEGEKKVKPTATFGEVISDLIEALQKIKSGDVKLGGLGGAKLNIDNEEKVEED
jgi:hypothetical protein